MPKFTIKIRYMINIANALAVTRPDRKRRPARKQTIGLHP